MGSPSPSSSSSPALPTTTATTSSSKPVPEGYRPHSEGQASILVPISNTAFLNPIQEYNRDLSVCVINEWSRLKSEEMEGKWLESWEKKAEKIAGGKGGKGKKRKGIAKVETEIKVEGEASTSVIASDAAPQPIPTGTETETPAPVPTQLQYERPEFIQPKFTILEALSATGLRSIRYAKELTNAGIVLANDFSPSACEAMRQNVQYNGVEAVEVVREQQQEKQQHKAEDASVDAMDVDAKATSVAEAATVDTASSLLAPENVAEQSEKPKSKKSFTARGLKGRKFVTPGVVVNQGDAAALLYQHRTEQERVDVVDLDPYGTAAPFIDGAVQAVADGGLLCVTCTDLAVLAGGNYPEKCFANYGGVGARAEYSHEAALRLVLNTISTSATRYGRYIEPLLCLSIDFYVRLFVRVHSGQQQVKHVMANHGPVYVCTYCQSHNAQPLGKVVRRTKEDGKIIEDFKFASGPPMDSKCEHCGQNSLVAGPMWLGSLHSKPFLERLMTTLEGGEGDKFKTYPRIKGMVTTAKEVRSHVLARIY